MDQNQKRTLIILIAIGFVFFIMFIIPNSQGSVDANMLAVFEQDEFAQYPHLINMYKTADRWQESVRRFFAYQHYYYGYPFYLFSAVVVLPIRLLTGNLESTPLNMLFLRQGVSVLPMLLTILIFVYLYTRFKSVALSVGLFLFLLSIPAVTRNNMWWHPESLAILFVVLTFFFLDRDNQRYGKNFLLAAVTCGLAVGTKMIGLFFFLTIPTYLVWGIYSKKIDTKRAFVLAVQFVGIMFAIVVISNPMLLLARGREAIFKIQRLQAEAMSFGWQVAYAKGPASWYGIITEYYGQWYLLVFSLLALTVGLFKGQRRMLNLLVLTWGLPYSVYLLFFVAIKPIHFFLPIALLFFAALVTLLPETINQDEESSTLEQTREVTIFRVIGYVTIFVMGIQFIQNVRWGVDRYLEELHREENSTAIAFFSDFQSEYLEKIPEEEKLLVYRDINVYVPNAGNFEVEIKWGVIDYVIISDLNPDLILLSRQRARDYTHPDVLENAQSLEEMQRTFDFYTDALNYNLESYNFLYEDDFGLAFLRENLYEVYFDESDN